jgi:hypothetical protein
VEVAAGCEAQKVDEVVVTGSGRARQYLVAAPRVERSLPGDLPLLTIPAR